MEEQGSSEHHPHSQAVKFHSVLSFKPEGASNTTDNSKWSPHFQLAFFDQIVDAMPEKATYLSQPRVIKEGRSTCVLRHMSDREIRESKKKDKEIQKDNGIQSEPDGLKQ